MRMAIWHAGNTISNILSGFLAAAILENMDNVLGLHAWQWFFIIEGAISIAVAGGAYFVLPSWPHNTKFLTPEETEMAQYRVMVSNGGQYEEQGGTWDGLKEAANDPFTWYFCAMHFALVTAQSFKDFMPSVGVTASIRKTKLTYRVSDYGNFWLQEAYHLLDPGSSLRHRLCSCLRSRLFIWQTPRVILAHRHPHHLRRGRLLYAHWYPKCRSALHRPCPPG
jgi:hypothetical protein